MKIRYFFMVALLALVALAGTSSASGESSRLAPATVTEFTSTSDTYISEPNPSISYGAVQTLNVDGGAEDTNLDNWALLKWNVSAIPAGSTVESASVTIFITDNGTSQTYRFYEVMGSWNESTTWNTKPAWGTTSLGAVGPFGSGAQTLSLNKAVVQKWVNAPGANNGVIIADSNNTSGFDFWAREYSTATQRPKLSVTWTAPAGANCTTQTELPPAECQALVALYTSTGGASWNDSPGNNWNVTQTPCSWTGVTCSEGRPRHVTNLDRQYRNLVGTIPDLSALTSLKGLNLADCQLSGTLDGILGLTSLELVDLQHNQLSGSIPNLSALVNLRKLGVDHNQLSGSIPTTLPVSVRLAILHHNHLSGSIPDLSALTNLEGLFFDNNRLSGNIPNVLPPNITYINLQNNQLGGIVPVSVCAGQLELEAIDLGYNMLTGQADPCVTMADPDWAATQTVPPTNVQAQYLTPTSLKWTWTPILYTGDGGYYEVRCANQSGGPYNQAMGTTATTGGKAATNFTATVTAGVHYYCAAHTFTPKHGEQQNNLTSIDSAEVYVPPDGGPQTYNVTKTADTNDGACTQTDCSLREAVIAANAHFGKDTINISAGVYLLTIAGTGEDLAATGDLDLTEEVIVKGAGSAQTTIDGNALDNVFDAKKAAEFRGLTVQNGKPRGIQHSGAILTDVLISNNPEGACCSSIAGGTFLNNGSGIVSCDVRGVTVRQNELGIFCFSEPPQLTLTVQDSTVSSNADGIVLYGNYVGSVSLVNVTLAQNALGLGAEIDGGAATADILNSTIVDNQTHFIFDGPLPTPRNSIVGASAAWGLAPFNGRYFDLRANSPAIDVGDNSICPTTDQIGNRRPVDGNGDGNAVCDLGAIEYQGGAPTPELKVPAHIPAVSGQPFPAPVQFTANGSSIASLVFSIDFDQQCLSFNPADGNGDGIPDAIAFAALTGFTKNAAFDANDTDGEIDITLLDIAPPLQALPDGTLAAITFNPSCQPQPGQTRTAAIAFSTAPAASFGSTTGQSITGRTVDGSADITSRRPELSAAAVAAEYYKKAAPVPIQLAARGAAIASAVFSLDFDQQCLALNPADGNGDGIPDAIAFEPLAGFTKNATFDANDADGEIDITISDIAPPLQALPDGKLITVSLTPICDFFGSPRTAAVAFASDPPASFGTTGGQSLPGTTPNGSITIPPILAGDCNGDGKLDAGDIPACVLEIFDGDGVDPAAAKGGSYAGTVGCDCNIDAKIDAGDITCTVLRIFGGYPGPAAQTTAGAPTLSAPGLTLAFPNRTITIPITLQTGGEAVASVAFSLDYDQIWLSLDPSDANSDGLPDSVHFSLPPGFTAIASLEPADADGELDVLIADLTPPLSSLPGGVLATLTFAVGPAPFGSQAPVAFAAAPAASFGSASGQSLPGHALSGAVLIGSHPRYLPLLLHQ